VSSCRPLSGCCRFSWFPGLPLPASWRPDFLLFCLWCCSESEDSEINLRLQHSNSLWSMSLLSFPCTLSSSQDLLHCILSLNSLCLHTLPMSKLHQQNSFFFLWGHDPDTLACKARPSFDGCGTSLSVSLRVSRAYP